MTAASSRPVGGARGHGLRRRRRRLRQARAALIALALFAGAATLAVLLTQGPGGAARGTGGTGATGTRPPGVATKARSGKARPATGSAHGRAGGGTGGRPAAGATPPGGTAAPAKAVTKTFAGPYGIESTAVIAENKRPGTTAWEVSGPQGQGYVEGFATTTYASAGQEVGLYVSTTARSFHVVAYRMGFYGGKGARKVWRSAQLPGHVQPPCPVAPGTNMVSCDNWSRSLTVTVGPGWPSGDYLLKLTGSGGQQSYVLLTVWAPASRSAYLVMARSLTEQAWNPYGGFDLYQGRGACAPGSASYPPCNRARVVSFDRPYGWGDGAADFLGNEYPLVRWAEQHGLDVSYCTDITVTDHPGVLLHHRALLSLDHDEVWDNSERLAALRAQAKGVNIVFFGAVPVLRHARLQPSPLGRDNEEVDYRDSAEDPLDGEGSAFDVTGNTWSSPPTSWDETAFVGEMYAGYLYPGAPPAPLVVYDPGSWIFKGTGLRYGSRVPGVIESDIDHLERYGPTPARLEVLAHSPVPLSDIYTNQGSWGGYTYSDMTYYTSGRGSGGVFDSGTVHWLTALATCAPHECPAPEVGRITGNLLAAFGQGPAGRLRPSSANWRSVAPSGS